MKRPWCLFTGKVYFKMVSLQQALHANELRILKKMIDSQTSNMSTIDFHKYWTVLETLTFSLRCYILWYPDRGAGDSFFNEEFIYGTDLHLTYLVLMGAWQFVMSETRELVNHAMSLTSSNISATWNGALDMSFIKEESSNFRKLL